MIIPTLNDIQKEKFCNEYTLLIKKWEKEFKLTIKGKLLSFISTIFSPYFLDKDWETIFKNSINKREELKRFAESDAAKEIIDCWIGMDIETSTWKKIINEIDSLQKEQKQLIKQKYNFDIIKTLFEIKIRLIGLNKLMNESVLRKVKHQEKIKELSKKLMDYKNESEEVILLGLITDIISKNEIFFGTEAAVTYSIIKNFKAEINNSLLFTKQLKQNVKKGEERIETISKDLDELIKNISTPSTNSQK